LDDFGEDKVKLEQLISGRRVKLAEDLSKISVPISPFLEIFCSDFNNDSRICNSLDSKV